MPGVGGAGGDGIETEAGRSDPIADEEHPESLSGLTGEVHDEAPTEFLAASLFIDDMPSMDYMDETAEAAIDEMEKEAEESAESMDDTADAVEDRADEIPE